ncbi:MAG: prenyltransferase [Chloroflexota bacterium]
MSQITQYAIRLTHFILLGRPLFLAGGFILHGLGAAIAVYDGATLNGAALLWGQVAVTAVQLMTHYSNDYFDLAADRANRTPTRWSGGSRILADGLLPPWVALAAVVLFSLVALTATLVLALVVQTGHLTLPLLSLAYLLCLGYSAPPLRLVSRGLGELSGALIVPGLTMLVGYYLQNGRLAWLPILAVVPLCWLQLAMLLAVAFPDAEGDRAAGKGTLVVRWGGVRAAGLYLGALLAAYTSLPFLLILGLPGRVAGAAGLGLPLALWLAWRVQEGDWAEPTRWGRLAFWTIGLLMTTAAAELVAFLLALDVV